ncbi:hypothetical protein KKH27_03180 [bacterium]|nr:hypothetical protein [bacterium]MBU1983006.1 hypothetical protein [bacterium]
MRIAIQSVLCLSAMVLALAVSCRGSGGSDGPFRELEFAVDSSRLGDPIHVKGLVVHAPAGWDEADSTLLVAVRQAVVGQASENRLPEFHTVRIQPETGGVLVITSFPKDPRTTGDFVTWARSFVEEYRRARSEVPVEEDWLKIGGMAAVQIYQADSLRIQFKYLIAADLPVGLDYSVPRAAWEKEVRSVESSLGSIRKK